jgi:hypothetical protein
MGSIDGGFWTKPPAGWAKVVAVWMGVDYKADVISVTLRDGGDRTAHLRLLHKLPALERISIGNIDLTEATMEQLRTLKQLDELWFTDPPLSDMEIAKLKNHLSTTRIRVSRAVSERVYETSLDLR